MASSDLKFGTSGLRGLAVELDGRPAFAYALAFGRVLIGRGEAEAGGRVYVGRDLRPSSPSIARTCAAGLRAAGLSPVDCGVLPTPALAAHALALAAPAIMVTGSHIPADRNGLKFYRGDGEIDKQDELAISREEAAIEGIEPPATPEAMPTDDRALADYRRRGVEMLPAGALEGMRVAVYQHSSVARDLFVDVLGALGAQTLALGRSDVFIPIDTEALRAEDKERAGQWAREHRFDALVSSDGDADRPLVADENGHFLRGDLVGAITASMLGADCVVTPVSSNSGIERSGRFARVLRTRIGSPYVIEGMEQARRDGARHIVGFEANGGVLVGSPAEIAGRVLPALPTRDALAPVLAVLYASRRSGKPLSAFAGLFSFHAAASGRIENVAQPASSELLDRLRGDAAFRSRFCGDALSVERIDTTDGVRMLSGDGIVLHYRASGNAPELRCYVEAADDAAAQALLAFGLESADAFLKEHEPT